MAPLLSKAPHGRVAGAEQALNDSDYAVPNLGRPVFGGALI
jgi:hypothetical protein